MSVRVSSATPDAPLKVTIDEELAAFATWFKETLGNDQPLTPSERAIVATYLAWKLKDPTHAPNPG